MVAGLAVAGWPLPVAGAIGIGAAFALGLVADAVGIAPLVRLAMQLGLGVAVAAGGLAAEALPGTALSWIVGAVVFAATLNVVNMVDRTDGLRPAAVAITALGLALVAAGAGDERPMQLSLVVAGAAAGFLVHSLPPARVFLGAAGAYATAAALAVAILLESR